MTFSANWFLGNEKNWTKWLDGLKGRDSLDFLEIGCFEGRATLWLFQNILTGQFNRMTVVDTFEGGMEVGSKDLHFTENLFINFQENLMPYLDKIRVFKGKSQEVLREDRYFRDTKFDFIYIDGSHRSPEILEDTMLSWGMLKKGGLMVFDDYGLHRYPDPKLNPAMAIDAFMAIFSEKIAVIGKGYQVCIMKK